MRLLEVLFGRTPSDDERSRKGEEIERLQVKSDATLDRAQQALDDRQKVSLASYRRVRLPR